ncbi:hypothetical protein Tco_0531408 [Tanacetum coccineum]
MAMYMLLSTISFGVMSLAQRHGFFVILISLDSSEESVGTSTARVILFGTIPTTIPSTAPTVDSFDTSERPPLQDPYEVTVARWRSQVAARSSPPSLPIRQILPAPPGLPRRTAILMFSGQPIPVGRPYRTQLNGVLQMLTARKRVGPLPTHQIALRYSADYSSSDHFTSDDSSRDSLSDSSSETSLDSHSDTSSDSSSRHSSSGRPISDSPCDLPTATSARPFRKRYRSPTTSVPVALLVLRALPPIPTDLLPPHEMIRDFDPVTNFKDREIGLGVNVEDSFEPYIELDIESNVQADIDACIAFADDISVRGTDVRVEVRTTTEEETALSARGTIKIGVDRVTHLVVLDDTAESVREDFPELVSADGSLEVIQRGLDVVMQELYDHMVEIPRDLRQIRRFRFYDRVRTMPTAKRSRMTQDAINELIAKCVTEALEAYDTARNPGTETEMENEQQDNNVEANVNNGNGNGNGNPNVNNGGVVPVTRECTYQDFMKCQPLNFKGTKGVIGLIRQFEKMETVFHINNCPLKYQVKYASCTLLDGALTWWNSHKRTVGVDATYAMTWKTLIKLMTEMAPEEEDKVEKYIGGLLDRIQGNVIVAEPTRL